MKKRITLKDARHMAGMTEKEVCTILRIRKDQLHAWETGKSVPSYENALGLSDVYALPLDFMNFSKEANKPPIAKKLTLKEIEALPFASVIWMSDESNDNGVLWHWKTPLVVYSSGYEGRLGGEVGGSATWTITINEHMFSPYSDSVDYIVSYWDHEPDDDQLRGLTTKQYDESKWDEEKIRLPHLAEAITGRKMTFDSFCKITSIQPEEFWKVLTGSRVLDPRELETVRTTLQLTEDEVNDLLIQTVFSTAV